MPRPVVIALNLTLLAVAIAGCASDPRDALFLWLTRPRQLSVGEPAQVLRIQVAGDVTYPITASLEVIDCPAGASCEPRTEEYPVAAEAHVMAEVFACEVADVQEVYELRVFDDTGLTTQPARFSLMCLP